MMRNAITVKRGILVGAAVGVALVVLWRRSRDARDAVAPAPAAPPQPSSEPAVTAEEPAVQHEESAVEHTESAVEHTEPAVAEAPAPEATAPETVAAAPEAVVAEPETLEAALAVHREAAAEHARRPVALTVGRQRDLGSGEWPQPRPVAALGAAPRRNAPPPRATWPGVAGARRGPLSLKRSG